MRGAARQCPARRTRPALRTRRAARCPLPADRRRGRGAGLEGGGAFRPPSTRLALSQPCARGLRRGRPHARRGVRHPRRPARDPDPPRRCPRRAARPARRADDRADLRRRDPRHRRLSGAARAGKPCDRQRQRGLRHREPGGRRLPARQRLLPHPAGRARRRPGRGRQGTAAEPAVLARRGAGPDGRAVRLRLAPARGSGGAPARRSVAAPR